MKLTIELNGLEEIKAYESKIVEQHGGTKVEVIKEDNSEIIKEEKAENARLVAKLQTVEKELKVALAKAPVATSSDDKAVAKLEREKATLENQLSGQSQRIADDKKHIAMLEEKMQTIIDNKEAPSNDKGDVDEKLEQELVIATANYEEVKASYDASCKLIEQNNKSIGAFKEEVAKLKGQVDVLNERIEQANQYIEENIG